MRLPDTFIVGAFKSGTTALYEYLRAHPGIFMSVPKEPMYFGADLTPRYERMTEQQTSPCSQRPATTSGPARLRRGTCTRRRRRARSPAWRPTRGSSSCSATRST